MPRSDPRNVEAFEAFTKWHQHFHPDSQPQRTWTAMHRFAEFLGYPNSNNEQRSSWIINIDNPDLMRKVRLINSAHGDTILKIMEIRNAKQVG